MEKVAQILVNIPTRHINKAFSYSIPQQMDYLNVGWRVLVSFGNRKVEGFVIKIIDIMDIIDEDIGELKPILDVLDSEPWFDDNMLQTAEWLSEYYLCPLVEAMRLFIPGKSGIKSTTAYRMADNAEPREREEFLASKPPVYRMLCEYLTQHGVLKLSQLEKEFGINAVKIIQQLHSHKLATIEFTARKKNNPKYQNAVSLAVSPDMAVAAQTKLVTKPAQHRLVAALLSKDYLLAEDLRCLNVSQDAVKRLTDMGIVAINKMQIVRDSYSSMGRIVRSINLSTQQQQALSSIVPAIETRIHHSFLLHGVTASGKTQVYMEAVAVARHNHRQAIILVPEIALTSQIVSRFKERFGDDVVVMHSKLSIGERHDSWQRLRSRNAGIVIGARSAVFAPVQDLGIIVIDEEHEFTYKQEERPRYHTREVALKRARLANAVVVLGSATPAIETYYQSVHGLHTLLNMSSRIDDAPLPDITVVDMREELKKGRRNVISLPLQELLTATLTKNEQAIILLNRRGYATFVMCRECGFVMSCPHCATSLVYHSANKYLRCHYCQTKEHVPDICPKCSSRYIRYFGTGTQKIEEELSKLLPDARIVRMDQDTTGGKMSHDKILSDFACEKYDILLGTQMVAKGHDVKNVTAVGIISADTVLNLPDFRAAEKAFALLTQAAGRAGRGEKPGQVVAQAYNPEHYAIQAGVDHDYKAFYQTEITYRHELNYPPFSKLIKITAQSNDEIKAWRLAEDTAAELRYHLAAINHTEVMGPFSAAVAKINDVFRINILIKTDDLDVVRRKIMGTEILRHRDIMIDVEPLSIM